MKEIVLRRGGIAIVDDEDYKRVNQFKWLLSSKGYAYRYATVNGQSTVVLMSRFILDPPDEMEVEHLNYIKLDYQKSNLRLAPRCTRFIQKIRRRKAPFGFERADAALVCQYTSNDVYD